TVRHAVVRLAFPTRRSSDLSCKDDDSVITNVPNAAPVVSSISPDRGKSGTEVTILGVNFGITAEANTVTFNGTKATVIAANEPRSEEHTSELQSRENLVCRL